MHEGDEWTLQFNHHEHWQSMHHFDLAASMRLIMMGNFWSGALAAVPLSAPSADVSSSAGRRQMTLTNFHFTHWENNHVVENDFADVSTV